MHAGPCIKSKAKSSEVVNTAAEVSFTTIPWWYNPTFAYNITIFIDRTSTYTITFTHLD